MSEEARKAYAKFGIDTGSVMKRLADIPISIQVWQTDDVIGFEKGAGSLSGGIQTTGNYPGRAKDPKEVMQDLEKALSLIPGKKRINLHASYRITDENVDRDQIEPHHFKAWVDFAKAHHVGLDFNPTFFSHPMVKDNLTLSSPDPEVRAFWIRHGKACRRIASYFSQELGGKTLCNVWIPDGYKDVPADRLGPRMRLKESLDQIFEEKLPGVIDSVESKVFGIGLESFTVGSNEFYLSYASHRKDVCVLLDNGHFHPTEMVSEKISALLPFFDYLPLHVTRPVRWDSDHVVRLDDEIKEIAKEIVRNGAEQRVLIGLDYFDASINRVAALVIGARNTQKALLQALLEPNETMRKMQDDARFTQLLAFQEDWKSMDWGDVWNAYCTKEQVPVDATWLPVVEKYEHDILSKRS